MKLTRLQITQLPGIQGSIHLRDLDPGLNLITGPNAVGKSSLIRALEYLAGGVRAGDPRDLVLEADFDNDAAWTVKRTASHLQWLRDGEPVAAGPRLPARDELHCYWLKVEDLLADDAQQDAALVAEIRTALAGGFDLPLLREGDFDFGPGRGRKEGRELRDARQRLSEVEAENQALQRDEQDLDRLQNEVDAARQGARERDILVRSLELSQTLSERRAQEAVLSSFPEGMEKLRGDELERLKQLDQRLAELGEDQLRIREQLDAAQRKLGETGLGASRPASHERRAAAQQLDALKARSGEIARQQSERARLKAERDQAQKALQGEDLAESAQVPDIAVATLERASQLAVRLRKLEIDLERLDSRIQSGGQAPQARRLDAHQHAVTALRAWLAGSSAQGQSLMGLSKIGRSSMGRLAMGLAALAGLGTAAAGAWMGLWWLLLPAALSLLAAGLMISRPLAHGTGTAQADFKRTGLKGPQDWQREAVEKRLAELESDLAELQLARRRAEAASEDQAERDRLQQQLDALNAEKRALAGEIGFDPALTAASVDFIARVVGQWQTAATEVAKVEASLRQLEDQQQRGLEALQKALQAWGLSVPAELAALEEALNDLALRCEAAEAAEREQAAAEDRQRQLDRQMGEREAERRALFAPLGLKENEGNGLNERLAQLPDWRHSQDSLRALARRETELRETLANAPKRLQEAETGEQEALASALEQANEQAERLESLLQEVSAIRERLRVAGKDQALESAMAREAQARNALREQHQQAMLAEAGQFLLDDVEGEYQSEHEPAVLADARQLFQRFTHHGFDLALDEEAGLIARDLEQDSRRRLSELSSGTRMQLLLSVRLAWTRRLEERCEPLPLFLDEALTTSDEHRFREMAENLASLATQEGRQIFYLSARQQEGVLWEQLAGLRPHHLDLAEIRFGQAGTTFADYRLPAMETLPEPADDPPEQWAAKVGIPAIDPTQPVGTMPLFYLIRDELSLLYRLMQRYRVRSLGQLESLLDSDVAEKAVPDRAWRKRLSGRCAAARAWQQAWRQGRGKAVDRAALEASGAVSDTFMERVCEQAEAVGGDGQALIKALANKAVSGFRNDKREELADWLKAEGYISPEVPLSAEERLQRTIWQTSRTADEGDTLQLLRCIESGIAR